MTTFCENLECSFPQGHCARRLSPDVCPDAPTSVQTDDGAEHAPLEQGAEGLPWSGDALSLSTMSLAFGGRRPHILALIGLPDAGKTSFITTLYDRLRHEPMGARNFAGSFTLRGWEILHQNLKWRDNLPPTYPPRTSGARREPGFLHLALRGDEENQTDVLLADTPGEWFRIFSRDDDVPGAKVTLDLADGLILIINPVSLNDSRRHASRQRLLGLIRRVKETVPEKPLVLILSHADQPVERKPEYEEVLNLIETLYPGHATYDTIAAFERGRTQDAGQNVLEGVAQVISLLEEIPLRPLPLSEREPLLARLILGEM